jgi:hypothetical protein
VVAGLAVVPLASVAGVVGSDAVDADSSSVVAHPVSKARVTTMAVEGKKFVKYGIVGVSFSAFKVITTYNDL